VSFHSEKAWRLSEMVGAVPSLVLLGLVKKTSSVAAGEA